MIKVCFYYNNNLLKRFFISGHDNSKACGENIICAAVSALVLSYIQSLTKILKLSLKGTITSGLIDLELLNENIDTYQNIGLEVLTKSLFLSLNSINEQHGGKVIEIIENIQVK